jgi:hypothetical protein
MILGLLLGAVLLPAAPLKFYTIFGPEAPGATGSGSGYFEFNEDLTTLLIDVTWTGLSGNTTVAHIHCCTTTAGTGTVGVAVTPGTLPDFPVGVTSGSYQRLIDLTLAASFTSAFVTNFAGGTLANAPQALLDGILDGKAYFNIHTNTFPGGEIRGFLAPVPEPGTMLLSGLGVLALLGMQRFRRKPARG